MTNLDLARNRSATRYSRTEMQRRVCWAMGRCLFQISPRPFFAFRRSILRCFGAKVGRNVNIYSSALVYYPWNLEIGDWSSIGEWALIYNLGKVTIGQRATISQRTHLCAGTHDYSDPALPLLRPPILVGDDVWICADAFLGPGVTVEKGAVVGARAVVTKNVSPWTVVAGNPARVIKRRTMEASSPPH